jgi:hypothetical protein
MENFNFPVELQPVMSTSGVIIQKKSVVIRTDTNMPLGIVSNQYELLKHEMVVNNFREALRGTEFKQDIQITNNGANLYATFQIQEELLEVRKGDFVSLQFTARNSYNGTNSLSISLGAMRLVCTNGMVIGKDIFTFSMRHIYTGNRLNLDIFKQRVIDLTTKFEGSLPIMQKMTEQEINAKTFPVLFNNKKLPKYINIGAKKEFEKTGDFSIWGFYNSLTNVITYNLRKQNPAIELHFGQIAWELATSIVK